MQRVEEYGLHGVRPAAVPVARSVSPSVAAEARELARQMMRSTPARTAAPAVAHPSARPPLEKRPAGARLGERSSPASSGGLLHRLLDRDPVLFEALRRDSVAAQQVRSFLDRLIASMKAGPSC